jgi:hypothetical protein
MPKLNIVLSHGLTQDEALKRIKNLLADVKTQFSDKIGDLKEQWDGNAGRFSFSAMGLPISGTLTVKPSTVELNGNLPFAAALFKGKIESTIRERVKTLLA